MSKKVVNKDPEERAQATLAPVFIELIKISADDIVHVEFSRDNMQYSVTMEKPDKQRPVDEFYENFRQITPWLVKQAELPKTLANEVRTTGLRLRYKGPGGAAMEAQMIGWRKLFESKGGYSISLPYKRVGEAPSTENGDEERPAEIVDGEARNGDGSTLERHADGLAALIRKQIELAQSYIEGVRATLTIFDKPAASDEAASDEAPVEEEVAEEA